MTFKIASVHSENELVINGGKRDGFRIGQRVLVYRMGDTIKDPDSGEILEDLEVVIGTGTVTHCQEKICTIHSDMRESPRRVVRGGSAFGGLVRLLGPEETILQDTKPFDDPEVGDLVKPI